MALDGNPKQRDASCVTSAPLDPQAVRKVRTLRLFGHLGRPSGNSGREPSAGLTGKGCSTCNRTRSRMVVLHTTSSSIFRSNSIPHHRITRATRSPSHQPSRSTTPLVRGLQLQAQLQAQLQLHLHLLVCQLHHGCRRSRPTCLWNRLPSAPYKATSATSSVVPHSNNAPATLACPVHSSIVETSPRPSRASPTTHAHVSIDATIGNACTR